MFQKIDKILFTTDLTDGAKEVFQQAYYLAEKLSAKLILLHVIEDIPDGSKSLIRESLGKEVFEKVEKEKEESARRVMIGKRQEAPMIEQVLQNLSEEIKNGSTTEKQPVQIEQVLVSFGKIDEQILLAADDNDCDLIVMGHRSRSVLSEALIGSAVRRVVRQSKKQVYLVPLA